MRGLLVLVVAIGCGGKDAPPAATTASGSAPAPKPSGGSASASGSGSGSGSPVAKTPDEPVVAAPTKPGELQLEDPDDAARRLAFGKGKVPKLPAISPDGVLIADYASDATGPMLPAPIYVSITPIVGKGKGERFELVDMDLALAEAQHADWEVEVPAAPIIKKLQERGAAVMTRLRAGKFATLEPIDVDMSSRDAQRTKIGSLVLDIKELDTEDLEISLLGAGGKKLQREVVKQYSSDEKPAVFDGGSCQYRPILRSVYRDQAKKSLYILVGFRFHEECTQQPITTIVWPLMDGPPGPADEVAAIATAQFDILGSKPAADLFAPKAQLIGSQVGDVAAIPFRARTADETYKGHRDTDVQVVLSSDGKSAWTSLTTTLSTVVPKGPGRDVPWRASSVLVKTAGGWRIAATTWTQAVADADANRDAKAGKLTAATLTADPGDATLRALLAKLTVDGVDPAAAARPDLVAIGSASGERTVGGAIFARGWNAAWKGHTTVRSSVARVAPSGTTGWVAASLELAKTGYTIPFKVFCVFDKTATGWTLVHIHFSV